MTNENNQQAEGLKVEKLDSNLIEQEREKEEFFEYTSKLLKDAYFLKQCKKYIKLKDEENNNEQKN